MCALVTARRCRQVARSALSAPPWPPSAPPSEVPACWPRRASASAAQAGSGRLSRGKTPLEPSMLQGVGGGQQESEKSQQALHAGSERRTLAASAAHRERRLAQGHQSDTSAVTFPSLGLITRFSCSHAQGVSVEPMTAASRPRNDCATTRCVVRPGDDFSRSMYMIRGRLHP